MSFCLNPDCPKPQNRKSAIACAACGGRLLLKERYRAVKLIGQGGFGRTLLAIDEDKPSQPRCVIKQFLPTAASPQFHKKAAHLFAQEAVRLEELGNHPQIPALLAYFSQEQHQYLVQEFIAGQDLAVILATQGAFSENQIRFILTSLLPVLEFIHARQVIHRDIKPANLIALQGSPIISEVTSDALDWLGMLQVLSWETTQGFRDFTNPTYRFSDHLRHRLAQIPQHLAIADYQRCQEMAAQFTHYARLGLAQRQYLVADASRLLYEMRRKYDYSQPMTTEQLVLVDFGAAKAVQALKGATSLTGTAIGSPGYTAPEQANGKAIFASDLYSLGVTCLHLLTVTSPFDLFDPHEYAWIWRRYLINPVSDKLGRILDKLIEPSINRRYRSATEVLNDLEPPALAAHPAPPANGSPPALGTLAPRPQVASGPPTPARPPAVTPPAVTPGAAAPVPPTDLPWQCRYQFTSPGKVGAIALSPTQPLLVSSSGTTIRLWDLQSGEPLRTLTGHLDRVTCLAISPDGHLLISGSTDKTIKFWALPHGNRLASLAAHSDTVLALAIAPDGQTLASSSLYDPILIWDMATGQERERCYGHDHRIDALAFSPDGKLLASGSEDKMVKLWLVGNFQEQTLAGHGDRVTSLVFSGDGKTLISGSWDGTVKFWSPATRRLKRTLEVGSGRIQALALSPNRKFFFTASATLNLWQLRTATALGSLNGHRGEISAIASSPISLSSSQTIGQTIASASVEGSICIWAGPR